MLAQALVPAFGSRHVVECLPRARLDVTQPGQIREAFASFAPEVVVHCAAFTRVDDCETRKDEAMRVNGIAPGYLAAALPAEALLVHVSTDFVFDGRKGRPYRELDAPCPLSEYGDSKLLGEKAVRSRRGEWLIVRTSWLFGHGGKNFVTTILEKARRGDPLSVVDDQRGCPTWSADLAGAIVHLVEKGETGLYHAAGSGEATWFDFAKAIVQAGGLATPVRPISSRDLDRPAVRPADSRLDTSKLATTGYRMLDWREALARFLAEGSP